MGRMRYRDSSWEPTFRKELVEEALAYLFNPHLNKIHEDVVKLGIDHREITETSVRFRFRGRVFNEDTPAESYPGFEHLAKQLDPSLREQMKKLIKEIEKLEDQKNRVRNYLVNLTLKCGTIADFMAMMPKALRGLWEDHFTSFADEHSNVTAEDVRAFNEQHADAIRILNKRAMIRVVMG